MDQKISYIVIIRWHLAIVDEEQAELLTSLGLNGFVTFKIEEGETNEE